MVPLNRLRYFPAVAAVLALSAPGVAQEASSAADSSSLKFLSNGTLSGLEVQGKELLEDRAGLNGFFALWFDGVQLREIRLPTVYYGEDGVTLTAMGPNGFPRLEFTTGTDQKGRVTLWLTRVEGMPRGKDASIMFRAMLSGPLPVSAEEKVEVVSRKDELLVYWPFPGQWVQGERGGKVTFGK